MKIFGLLRLARLRLLPALLASIVAFCSPAAPVAVDAQAAPSVPLTTLRVGDPIDPLPLLVAIDRGYFAQQHLDIKLVRLPNTAENISALVSGSEDIFYADTLAFASAVSNGIKVALFQSSNGGDAAPQGGFLTLLVRPSSGSRTPADLRGKQIGVAPTPIVKLVTRLWLQRNGVDPDSVTFVTVTPMIAMGGALKNQSVDAVVDGDPFTEQLEKQYGFVALGYPSREEPPNAAVNAFIATTDWLRSHPDAARGFAIAIRAGARWANAATPEEKAAVLAKFTPVDLGALESQVPGIVRQFHYFRWSDGPIDVAVTQRWLDLSFKNNALDKPVQLDPYLWPLALDRTLR